MPSVPRSLWAVAAVLMALSGTLLDPRAAFAQAPQDKFAEVNGVKLHYLVAGKGDPVVLLHGYAQTSHMWLPLIAKLADKHTVIAPDLRGFGQSAAPPIGYTKAAMARDIHALMVSLKYHRIRLVGHDIGLMVAYAYAAQYPDEVDRLVLMEAFLPGVGEWNNVFLLRDLWHFHFYGASGSISNISGTILPPMPKSRCRKKIANSTPRPMRSPATWPPEWKFSVPFRKTPRILWGFPKPG
jgi:pimeloyl-ACP methyl ester carboxylesterase